MAAVLNGVFGWLINEVSSVGLTVEPWRSLVLGIVVTMITFGKAQYQWHADRKRGHADPDNPPATSTINGGNSTTYTLPAASLTILRGKLQAASGSDPGK